MVTGLSADRIFVSVGQQPRPCECVDVFFSVSRCRLCFESYNPGTARGGRPLLWPTSPVRTPPARTPFSASSGWGWLILEDVGEALLPESSSAAHRACAASAAPPLFANLCASKSAVSSSIGRFLGKCSRYRSSV